MTSIDGIGIIIGAASTIAAVVSLLFAWRAVRVAEKSSASGMFTELHKIYQGVICPRCEYHWMC
jgi:hypothetical protein